MPSGGDIEKELRQVAESLVLADMTFRKGKIAEAEPMYERALAMLIRTYAEAHPDVDACLLRLGDIYFAREKYAQAMSTYIRLHELRARTLSNHHLDTLAISFKIAKAQEKLERFEDAEKTYTEAVGLGEQWLQPGHPLVGSMMESFAILLRKNLNQPQRATDVEQRAKEYRKKYTGPKGAGKKSLPSSVSLPFAPLDDDEQQARSLPLRDESLLDTDVEQGRPSSVNFLLIAFVVLCVLVVPIFIGWTMINRHPARVETQAPTQPQTQPASFGATTIPAAPTGHPWQDQLPVRNAPMESAVDSGAKPLESRQKPSQSRPRPIESSPRPINSSAEPVESRAEPPIGSHGVANQSRLEPPLSVHEAASPAQSHAGNDSIIVPPGLPPIRHNSLETPSAAKPPLRDSVDKPPERARPRSSKPRHAPVSGVWSDIYKAREKYTH